MASKKTWRILFSHAGENESVIVEARDRRAARETFLGENPHIHPKDVARTVLVPD